MTIRPADRKKDLAAIHVMAAQLGMDTSDKHPASEYRSMLYTVGGPTARRGDEISAAFLDHVGRQRVRAHLYQLCRARGIKTEKRETSNEGRAGRPTPAPDRVKMVRKIRAMLYYAGRPHEYADAIAKSRFHVERYEWLLPDQMRRLIAMFEYDRARQAVRAQREAEARQNRALPAEG